MVFCGCRHDNSMKKNIDHVFEQFRVVQIDKDEFVFLGMG